jgi:hypothetical protein
LNHNIKLDGIIYHIQTEKLGNENAIVTQIFNNGHVIYTKKIILTNENDEEIKVIINNTHKETLLYLRRETMNLSELKQHISTLIEESDKGILATDIFDTNTGMPIAGHNSNPKASALFNRIFNQLIKTLEGSGFNAELSYYYLLMDNNQAVVVGKLKDGKYRFGMLVDLGKVQLGMLLSVLLPEYIDNANKSL